MIQFKPATKQQKKLRLALMGPSGSGKTFTSLTLATGLARGGRIAVLDTERGRASLHSSRFTFDACEINNFDPKQYIEAIRMAAEAGYEVLVLDSLSHAWVGEGGVLDKVSAVKEKRGNAFTDGWGKVGTPLQNQLIDAIMSAPLHIIATMRVKTEYVVEQVNGKATPRRVGMAALQRDGVEYEFDMIGVMNLEHTLTFEKTFIEELADAAIHKPDLTFAERLLRGLSEGAQTSQPMTHVSEAVNANELAFKAQAPLTPEEQRESKVQDILTTCKLLNEAGDKLEMAGNVRLPWTGKTLTLFIEQEFHTTGGMDALSFDSLQKLQGILNLRLDKYAAVAPASA